MIGRRAFLLSLAGVAAVVPVLGAGAPRPEVVSAARRLVVERATRVERALVALEDALAPALDAARAGSARVVAGDDDPAPMLNAAADAAAAAEPAAAEARAALDDLERARRAATPGTDALASLAPSGELESIAGQLRETAEAGDAFAAMRRRAENVAVALEGALAALEDADLEAARSLARDARADHEAVAAWDVDFATLPVWIETTDAMIGAVERIIAATERGDAAAAEAAAAEFAELADDGATADRALRIAIGEGGSAVAATPLERLASVLATVGELRSEVASIREAMAP